MQETIEIIKSGGVGVLPTDTIYGLVGQALNPETVARIYRLKKRSPDKPSIVMIGDLAELEKFQLAPNKATLKIIEQFWPGPTSIIFSPKLSFRLPKPSWLRELLRKTGPLIASSANPEGRPPAQTTAEAEAYFGNHVDFYHDAGCLIGKPSTLIDIKENGAVEVIRK